MGTRKAIKSTENEQSLKMSKVSNGQSLKTNKGVPYSKHAERIKAALGHKACRPYK